MTTIVTGLFDIGREKIDGRNFNQYLDWFKHTLSINSPMVVYVEPNLKNFVSTYRTNKNTKIITQSLNSLYFMKYKEKMDMIISSEDYKNKISDASRIECNSSLYSIIQYSKFIWMDNAANKNFFNSSYFIWMDAGLSRFFNNLDTSKPYPSVDKHIELLKDNDKILLQVFMSHYPDLFNASCLSDNYLFDNRSYVTGGIFGGTPAALKELKKYILKTFDNMLKNNNVNNEQIVLGYLLKKYPNLFKLFINNSAYHKNYELINVLGTK